MLDRLEFRGRGAVVCRSAACAVIGLWLSMAPGLTVSARPPGPVNLATTATIQASSTYSPNYKPQFVADGEIPGPESHKDVGKAWCARGNRHDHGVSLTFQWDQPVAVAQLVYFGRTAWQWEENWKDYQVFVEDSRQPIASGKLRAGHGPQPINLPKSCTAHSLTLRFTSSYGGSNPGASEIQVFATPQSAQYFNAFTGLPKRKAGTQEDRPAVPTIAEDPALRSQVADGSIGFTQVVVVKRHAIRPTHVYTYHTEGQSPGGGLYVADLNSPTPKLRCLVDANDGLVLDAELSYDGQTVLFSWKPTMADPLQLYAVALDGTELRQITHDKSNNLNACWLPDGGIAFLSDRKPAYAYCWTSSTPILYRCDADGSNVRRLSANYLNDFTPAVLDNGRIIYSRWEYVDRPAIPIQSLWSINPDGTGLAGYFGNRVLSPATFMEARQIPGTDTVLCVLTSHNGPCRGAIGIIDPTRGANTQRAITNLTPEVHLDRIDQGNGNNVRGPYESPHPIDEEFFLVSRNGTILIRDYAGTKQATLLESDEDGTGFYSARPVLSRPLPPVRPTRLKGLDSPWASVLVQDVYDGLEPHVARGEIVRIAVVQEIEKSKFADVKHRAFGFQFPVVSCGATYAPKKIWGYARVESDGSAHFQVPAGVPIYFMALDAEGRAVQRMRSFTHLMPNEHQACVGCHSDRNQVSPRVAGRPLAARRPAESLEPPIWGVTGFSYPAVVQPVLDVHCVDCHNAKQMDGNVDLTGDKTDFFNVSYEYLARQGKPGENPYTKWIPTFNGQEANILKVEPKYWGSPASLLADLILDGHPDARGTQRVRLSAAEQQAVFAWIDLDVPYYGTSESNHYDVPGCRQLMPADLDRVLKDVSARRCSSCHDEGIPRQPFVRITHPERNSFLLAPLSRTAGGIQACGQAVFSSPTDPDYQAILDCFRSLEADLQQTPRKDMCRVE